MMLFKAEVIYEIKIKSFLGKSFVLPKGTIVDVYACLEKQAPDGIVVCLVYHSVLPHFIEISSIYLKPVDNQD